MLLLTTLLCLAITPCLSGELGTIKTSSAVYSTKTSSLREPRRVAVTSPSYPCVPNSNTTTTCSCQAACLEPESSSNTWKGKRVCIVKTCYSYDPNLGAAGCKDAGPSFVSALVLQAIPFTGVFGSGFGNMGRWDLFGIAMGMLFGGIAVGCCCACACAAVSGEDSAPAGACCFNCYALFLAIALFIYWILGIVWIAEKSVLGPHGCKLI